MKEKQETKFTFDIVSFFKSHLSSYYIDYALIRLKIREL